MTPTEILQLILITVVLAAVIIMGAIADRHADRAEAKAERAHEEIVELRHQIGQIRLEDYRKHKTPQLPMLKRTSAGMFKITHYTPCLKENGGYDVTSTGMKLEDCIGWAVAANKEDFAIGTLLYITGYGYFTVLDTGVRKGVLDVLVGDKQTAFDLGVVEAEVFVLEGYNDEKQAD